MERKFCLAYFQGDQTFGFVGIGKEHFGFLYLKLGFACDTKETVIQFNLRQVVVVAAFEPVGDCVKVSLLCEARVFGFFLILLCERPCTFVLFFVLLHCHLVLSDGRVNKCF